MYSAIPRALRSSRLFNKPSRGFVSRHPVLLIVLVLMAALLAAAIGGPIAGAVAAGFGAKTDFGTGTTPSSVAVGDFNNDGKLDLAVANSNDNTVSILLGTGTGSFGAKTDFGTGSSPFSVAMGDFNGDGKLDLAVANNGAATVSILLGTGTGSFGAKTDFGTGSLPRSVAVGDFNGDGRLDLAVANGASATVSILLGTGTGSFGAKTDFGTGSQPISVAVGDFNGDGKLDLAVANSGSTSNTVSILLGTGTGSFGAKTDFGTGNSPRSVAVGDFNGDGKLDLAVANQGSATVSILLGTGTGSFGLKTDFGTGSLPFSVDVGDFNGDGKLDLAVANFIDNTVSILLGTGTGSFGAKTDFGTGGLPRSVAVGDFNGDGKLDLAVANQNNATVSILLNTTPIVASGVFCPKTDFGTGSQPISVAVGDFNGDGQLDLAVANSASATVSILLGTGTGSFGAKTDFGTGSQPLSVAVGDFNGDGRLDLAVANVSSDTVSILLGTGTGSFGAKTDFGTGSQPISVAVGDFNGDGKLDLAVANSASATVSILLGTGTGSFGAKTDFGTGDSPNSVAVGDFNGDGKLDLAVANFNSTTVSILLGTGTGSFGAKTDFGTGSLPASVAVGDFNGDGKLDLAVANFNDNTVSILLGTGTGSFGAKTDFGTGSIPFSVAVGDFNGDGKLDLAVANANSATVSILLGTGTGSFGAKADFGTDGGPESVAVGEFNRDGKLDLAAANFSSNNVSILLDNTPPTPTIAPSGTATFCVSGTLTSSSSTGNQWYKDNNLLAGETNQTLNVTASGSYTVTVTDSSCPSAPSAATTVTVNPNPATPTITPGGPTTFCQGNSVTLTSSSASGNQWYLNGNPIGGETNQTYVASATGNYTVQVTDGNNCQSSPSGATSVTVNPIPPTPTITPSGSTTACDSLLLTSSSASGNQWYKDNVLLPGQTNSTYNATASGSYTVTVTNGSGCTSAASAPTTVTVQRTAITVINASDSGTGSLRQAIADACSSGATINFDPALNGQTITLTSGELAINKNLTITGPGANLLTISGNNASRIFNIGNTFTVSLSGLTMSNGRVNTATSEGGAIQNNGTLTITGSTISGNTVNGSGLNLGAGISNRTTGNLTLRDSTISGNSATGGVANDGGGIYNQGVAKVINSTISGNSSTIGGGISVDPGGGNVSIINSTVSGNSASFAGGGLHPSAGTVNVRNTIVAGNTSPISPDVRNAFVSQGNNLIGASDGSTGFTNGVNNDKVGTVASPLNALLGPLGNYGGPTQTFALLPGSPAIDAANNCVTDVAHCGDANLPQLTSDQRGFGRQVNGRVDIGSFESRGFTIAVISGTPQSATILNTFGAPLIASVTGVGGEPVNGGLVTFTAPAANASAVLTGGGSTANVSIASGQASINATANGTAGSYNVSASAIGATSASFSLTNNQATTTTAVSSSVNPSDFGQSVTFTATVTSGAGTPPGTVQFKDNGNNLGAAVALNPSGVAQVSTSTLTVGTHTITADYNGDTNFATSTGTLTGGQVVKAQPTLSINDVSIAEGDTGTTAMSFTVTLSAASNLTAKVDFATANGTAAAPSDYLATNGTLTFNPGDLTKTISVTINGDVNFEPNENFTVNLTNAVNAGISKATGTGTIQNDDPAGGVIAMSKTDDTVSEATGFITVTVVRTKDVSQAVNVDYATDDTGASTNCATLNSGLASSRCDFTLMLGTLKFAANETQKTVDIPINRDGHLEGPETFKFVLSNPTGGAILAGASSLNITITDSVVPSANAIDDTDLFVRQQYHDFLNREPDADGLAFWKDNIDKCMDATRIPAGQTAAQCLETQRVTTSAAFFLSIEFRQTGGLVRDFYVASLDRPATNNMPNLIEFTRDTQAIQKGVVVGQGNWQAQLATNQTAFMDDFVTRAEFVGLYPTTDTPTQYVDKLYLHANVTPGSAQERNDAIAEFGGAATAANAGARGRALLRITQNVAFQAREINRAFVQMEYFGYLRRNPNDPPDNNFNGYNFWLAKLNQFNGDFLKAEMVKAFLSSDEYRRRFGP